MKKVALISLGCAKNLVDSEVMLGYLEREGYAVGAKKEEAEIIIINTCGFIQSAKKEALYTLKEAIDLKIKEKVKKIIVAGCYVQRNKETLKKTFPEIDTWMGVNDFDMIVQIVEEKPFESASSCFLYDHASPRLLSTPRGWTYVKISEGCSHQCSFCAIPAIKGPYHSRSISSITQEVTKLVSNGIKEINLVSQDSTYFGRDLGLEDGLSLLLRKLFQIQNLDWIRILYGYPEEINDSLLEVMQEKKICSYLDIPFQHSDQQIIRNMKRGLDGPRALRLIQKIRRKLPDVALRTSLIVGFPGEGKNEFENLENFVKEARFEHLGVFSYSHEEATDCFMLGNPIKESVKNRRREKILEIQTEISYQNNAKYLNCDIDVLIEGHLKQDPGVLVGRGQFQAPEVDGVVFVDSTEKDQLITNSIQKVEITDRDVYDLYGAVKK